MAADANNSSQTVTSESSLNDEIKTHQLLDKSSGPHSKGMVSGSNWAGLPEHLLDMILEKLNLFTDYAQFSAVCALWYYAAMENREKFLKKLNWQLPLLLVPKKDDEKGEMKKLYNVITKKFIDQEVRIPFSTRYGGSSRGWLIIVGDDYVVTLINPITPTQVIKLPPISKDEVNPYFQIHKAILSSDPSTEPRDYQVVVIYGGCGGQLASIRPGRYDTKWTYGDKVKGCLDDIIYYKGRLHAVDGSSKMYCFDQNLTLLQKFSSLDKHEYCNENKYLVESFRGDLLLVCRDIEHYYEYTPKFRDTKSFEVYKWNPSKPKPSGIKIPSKPKPSGVKIQSKVKLPKISSKPKPSWVKMKSLDGESLFLGDSMSMSIPATIFPGCSPNSIYFTHDFDDILRIGDRGPIDSGIFNLEDSTISPFYYVANEDTLLSMAKQPPIWFVPNS